MRIYTKTGDDGKTSLIGDRRKKYDIRVEAYGTIDELNSFVQLCISLMDENCVEIAETFNIISHLLFNCAGDLADANMRIEQKISSENIVWLEGLIDEYISQQEKLKHFVLPGGCQLSASIHVCRTIARRAERRIVELADSEAINKNVQIFINRLSDYFFVAARKANQIKGCTDAVYEGRKSVFRGKRK